MQKQAPSAARLIAMAVFTMSCFGLLLFLWASFGGVIPLKSKQYRIKAQIAESTLLVKEAEVRIAGLNVGRVKKQELRPQGGTLVEMEIADEYAPLPKDTRVLMRQKSLLGQIYIELSPGQKSTGELKDGSTIPAGQVEESVELDEIIRTFNPETRHNIQGWVKELATAIDGRGEDLNTAIGNLRPFATDGAELLSILDEQEPALRGLIRNASIAVGALNQREGEFRRLIVNANGFFDALASRDEALADTIQVFPTFLEESRLSVARLERFATDTRPLVRDLIPVAIELRPALADLGALSPDLKRLFRSLDPLITESKDTLPEAARFLRGARPVFGALHVYLPQLNPILSYLNFYQEQVADFIMNGAGSLSATLPGLPGEGPRHYLRQMSVINSRGVGLMQTRPEYDRGNAYGAPNAYKRARLVGGIVESWDCKPVAGGKSKADATAGSPPCWVAPPSLYDGLRFPRLKKNVAPVKPPPKDNAGTRPAAP